MPASGFETRRTDRDTPSPVIEVLVATMGAVEPLALVERMGLCGAGVRVLVINQCPGGEPPPPFERGAVRMVSFAEKGLARSRNRALEHTSGDIVLLADDDVRYLPNMADEVRRAFALMPRAAAITFRFCDAHSGRLAKRYPGRPGAHDALSVAGVSSIEIALWREAVAGLRFDERFGLGAEFPSGEEAILLRDLQRCGGFVGRYPATLCEHPGSGSGHAPWDLLAARGKGAVLRRMYPVAWPAALGVFMATKYRPHGRQLGRARFARALAQGAVRPAVRADGSKSS